MPQPGIFVVMWRPPLSGIGVIQRDHLAGLLEPAPARAPGVGGGRAGRVVVLTFPLRTVRTEESVNQKPYTVEWKGDQVTAISPPGERLPMFPAVTPSRRSRRPS